MITTRLISKRSCALLAAVMVAAGCSSDSNTLTSTSSPSTSDAGAAAASTESIAAGDTSNGGDRADRNGDGKVVVGYVVAGDSKDGAFYQGQADKIASEAQQRGWTAVVVDKVNPATSADTFENLARQGADLIVGGGAELETGLAEAAAKAAATGDRSALYLLIADFPPSSPDFATAGASENQAHYLGGAAMGLALTATGGSTACIVAGPELPFVKAMAANITAGMRETAPGAKLLVTYTGDFENASLAKAAFKAQISQGCKLVYPYLGGAITAVLTEAADAKVGIVGTSIDVCGVPGVDVSILYNPSFLLHNVLTAFSNAEIKPGKLFGEYGVDSDTGVGAKLCSPTGDAQVSLNTVRQKIIDKKVDPDAIAG